MQPDATTLDRLLGALETLTLEEHHLLDQGLYAEAVAVQSREIPLVHRIVELLGGPGCPPSLAAAFRPRAQRLIEAQQKQSENLGERIAGARTQLDEIRAAEIRIAKVRPSYGRPAADTAPRLSFAGQG